LGGSAFFTSDGVARELDSAMQKLGVALAEDSLDYHPPTWELIKDCTGKLRIGQTSDFVFNYIPCGYEVKQDSLNQRNFSLVRTVGQE
jgi:hypothetical protein